MASSKQQRQLHLIVGTGVLVGTGALLASYRTYNSFIQAQRSCLEHTPPHYKHSWLNLGLCTLSFHPRQCIPTEVTLWSCSWSQVFLRNIIWSDIFITPQVGALALLLGLLAMALVARELLLYARHLQHVDPDAFDCSCGRHKSHSFSRTAYCTFSAHRQDLHHLLQILVEEAASFYERLIDRFRISKEEAKLMHLLSVWLDRYTKMVHAKAFIKGYKMGETKGRRLGYKEGRAAGFIAGEQKGRLERYKQGWKDGYHKGRKRGFKRGKRVGYDRGYNDGYDEGKAKGKAESMDEAAKDTRH